MEAIAAELFRLINAGLLLTRASGEDPPPAWFVVGEEEEEDNGDVSRKMQTHFVHTEHAVIDDANVSVRNAEGPRWTTRFKMAATASLSSSSPADECRGGE